MNQNASTGLSRIPWPPLVLLNAIGLSWAMGRLVPLWSHGSASLRVVGWAVFTVGLALDIAAVLELRRHRANVLPTRAATTLVMTGPYRFSRNPIYLGNCIILIGLGFAGDNAWYWTVAGFAAWSVERLAIRPEERHLAQKFGDEWVCYRAKVGRWLGRQAE